MHTIAGFFYAMRWTRHHFEHRETITSVLVREPFLSSCREALLSARRDLEDVIRLHPTFQTTHAPFSPPVSLSNVAERMCRAADAVGTGPMAAVAGAFAEAGLRAMLDAGAEEAVVDNGGDIALCIRKPVRIGIWTGASPLRNLAFEVDPRPDILGICTSSGTVGHSFSYGQADAAIVVSPDVALADAAATALGNRVRSPDDLDACFSFLEPLEDVEGALVILGERIAMWGTLPKLVRIPVNPDLITKGESISWL